MKVESGVHPQITPVATKSGEREAGGSTAPSARSEAVHRHPVHPQARDHRRRMHAHDIAGHVLRTQAESSQNLAEWPTGGVQRMFDAEQARRSALLDMLADDARRGRVKDPEYRNVAGRADKRTGGGREHRMASLSEMQAKASRDRVMSRRVAETAAEEPEKMVDLAKLV